MTSINGSCDNARSTPWWTLTLHIFQTAFWEALQVSPARPPAALFKFVGHRVPPRRLHRLPGSE